MPSGPSGIFFRRVVLVFLGTSCFFHEDSQVASAALGPGGLRVPTGVMTTLSQAANNKGVNELARGRLFAGAKHPKQRRELSGLYPTTTRCIEGQSFSVASSQSPELNGCYTESGLGRTPRVTGEYMYILSKESTDGIDAIITTANTSTTAVLAILIPGLDTRLHWTLVSALEPTPPDLHTVCVSILPADRFHHPADGRWICDFSGNRTDAGIPDKTEFSVSCGCSGARTPFDRQAALPKVGQPPGWDTNTQYHSQYTASRTSGVRIVWVMLMGFIGLAARMEHMRRLNRIVRLRRLIRARVAAEPGVELPERVAEAGVELPERDAEAAPLLSAQPQVTETEQ